MPDFDARVIVNNFLRLRASDAYPQQMQIQKLVFTAHGWNLAVNNQPLVEEPALAWDNGPVFPSIWDHIRDDGYSRHSCLLTGKDGKFQAGLTRSEAQVIREICR